MLFQVFNLPLFNKLRSTKLETRVTWYFWEICTFLVKWKIWQSEKSKKSFQLFIYLSFPTGRVAFEKSINFWTIGHSRNFWVMCDNPGTWHKWKLLVKNRANEQTRKQNKIKKSKSAWEQSCQCHLGTIVTTSIGSIGPSVIWEPSYQSHLRTVVSVSSGNNPTSVTWEQSCKCHMRTIMELSKISFKSKNHKSLFFVFILKPKQES